MLTKIKKLDVDAGATIELVSNENKTVLILKSCDPYEVFIETAFVEELAKNNLPHLALWKDDDLQTHQLLIEYVEGSPTIGKQPSVEYFKKWGIATRAIHQVTSTASIKICEDGAQIAVNWNEFVKERIAQSAEQQRLHHTLSEDIIILCERALAKLLAHTQSIYSLIHGDLHNNNVIIRRGELVLFDKGHYILYGHPYYDLAIFGINFCWNEEKDILLRKSFIEGYGENFTNSELFELYVLLRSFERHGNRFEPQTKILIERLSQKYS